MEHSHWCSFVKELCVSFDFEGEEVCVSFVFEGDQNNVIYMSLNCGDRVTISFHWWLISGHCVFLLMLSLWWWSPISTKWYSRISHRSDDGNLGPTETFFSHLVTSSALCSIMSRVQGTRIMYVYTTPQRWQIPQLIVSPGHNSSTYGHSLSQMILSTYVGIQCRTELGVWPGSGDDRVSGREHQHFVLWLATWSVVYTVLSPLCVGTEHHIRS